VDLLDLVGNEGFATRSKSTMVLISHALEDAAQAAGPGTRLHSGFQLASLYAPEAERYARLTDAGVRATAWYAPDAALQPAHPVVLLQPGEPWCAGWWVVVSGPNCKLALVAADLDGLVAPTTRRRFRGILTFDPMAVDALEARLAAAAGQSPPADPVPTPDALTMRARLAAAVASRLADYLEGARQREREQARLKETLAGAIVHDLRNPLQLLMGWTDILQQGVLGPIPPGWDEAVREMHEAGESLNAMIGTVLDAFKLEAGKMRLRRKEIAPADLLARVAKQTAVPGAPPARVAVATGTPPLSVDADLVERTLVNLVGNARKYAPGSEVELAAYPTPEAVEVAVRDRGSGLPEDAIAGLFGRFTQVDSQGPRRGSGMGLYFCRLVAEAHGGTIVASNRPGGGAEFVLRLP
jgi:signal transduction histidine kinase